MGTPLLTHFNLLSPSPGFGPVFITSDPDSFWQQLNEIHALGGGDEPEMCLSALEVCPTPPLHLLPFQVLPPRGTRAFLGPPSPSPPSELSPPSFRPGFQGPLTFNSVLPGSTHSPAATMFNAHALPPCQLALLHTPPLSDIFVFTDASPKDAMLTSRVESLTQERRCRVSTADGDLMSATQGCGDLRMTPSQQASPLTLAADPALGKADNEYNVSGSPI